MTRTYSAILRESRLGVEIQESPIAAGPLLWGAARDDQSQHEPFLPGECFQNPEVVRLIPDQTCGARNVVLRGQQGENRRMGRSSRLGAERLQFLHALDCGGRLVLLGPKCHQEIGRIAGADVIAVLRLLSVAQHVQARLQRLSPEIGKLGPSGNVQCRR